RRVYRGRVLDLSMDDRADAVRLRGLPDGFPQRYIPERDAQSVQPGRADACSREHQTGARISVSVAAIGSRDTQFFQAKRSCEWNRLRILAFNSVPGP